MSIGEDIRRHYARALTEIEEFCSIIPFLHHLQTMAPAILREKLSYVLSGPASVPDETNTSNHARNTLFELVIGARLWRRGLNPVLSTDVDIKCQVMSKDVLIECKRPLGPAEVKPNIKDANRQLFRYLKREPPGTRGIVAISLARLATHR
jgi:hypothetical protein